MTAPNGYTPNRSPAFYALHAVDAAYMGVCCAKGMVAALEAILGLANTAGLAPADAVRQLARIGRKAARARRAAAEHLDMLTDAHAEVDGTRRALKEMHHAWNSDGGTPPVVGGASPQELHADPRRLLDAFSAMDAEAKEFVLAIAQRQSEMYPALKPAPHLRLVRVQRKDAPAGKR